MELTLDDIVSVVNKAVQIGYMQAVKAYEPTSDYIKKTELNAYLRLHTINKKNFDALVDNGYIVPRHKGKAQNSAIVYSKKEIQQALLSLKLGEISVNHLILKKNVNHLATDSTTTIG